MSVNKIILQHSVVFIQGHYSAIINILINRVRWKGLLTSMLNWPSETNPIHDHTHTVRPWDNSAIRLLTGNAFCSIIAIKDMTVTCLIYYLFHLTQMLVQFSQLHHIFWTVLNYRKSFLLLLIPEELTELNNWKTEWNDSLTGYFNSILQNDLSLLNYELDVTTLK